MIALNWIFIGLTIAALFALPIVGRRAFSQRTYLRLVIAEVVVLLLTANVLPLLPLPGIDASLGMLIVASSALAFAGVRSRAMLPARRQWIAEAKTDPLVLAAPFEGPWRVAAGGPDPLSNHHLIASDQRFAYDFVRVGGKSLGAPIFAPVAGRVVSACDGQLDHPASFRVTEDPLPLGNHVAIDSGRGVVFLCHLQNGSVLARLGETVEAGTPIGRCGNSGRTSRPHLHVHAQDLEQYAFNRARGIPIALSCGDGQPVAPRAWSIIRLK